MTFADLLGLIPEKEYVKVYSDGLISEHRLCRDWKENKYLCGELRKEVKSISADITYKREIPVIIVKLL